MAHLPPLSKQSSLSSAFLSSFQPPPGALGVSPSSMMAATSKKSQQFGSMINEIERVRSRFESEKSQSDQFSQQMAMLAKQIESLTSQQTSMLGFHIGRMDLMLKELKNSQDALSHEEQRAFESEQRAKLEQEERERRERADREELERKQRAEREHRERMAKLEREETERRDVEERERREREERELREKLERLEKERKQREEEERANREKMQKTSLPSMNLSDIIPQPSRTVTAPKRKLSLDLSATASTNPVVPMSVDQGPPTKRAKTSDSADVKTTEENKGDNDFQSMFQRFMDEKSRDGTANAPQESAPAADASISQGDDAMVDVEIPSASAEMPTMPDLAAMDTNTGEKLPDDIHEQLKMQAMAMLQAQLAAGNGDGMAPLADLELPPMGSEVSPTPQAPNPMAAVKPEPGTQPNAVPQQELAKPDVAAPPAKVEAKPQPAVKAEAKPKSAAKPKKAKGSKVVTPAVEDTTIADPMSVPLKNKAIHQWMLKDPERLYTADDICKAGIRYRSHTSNKREGTIKGSVYILNDKKSVSQCLRRYGDLFICRKSQGNKPGKWKAMF